MLWHCMEACIWSESIEEHFVEFRLSFCSPYMQQPPSNGQLKRTYCGVKLDPGVDDLDVDAFGTSVHILSLFLVLAWFSVLFKLVIKYFLNGESAG